MIIGMYCVVLCCVVSNVGTKVQVKTEVLVALTENYTTIFQNCFG